MSNFHLLPKPTSMLHQIRIDSDDLSVDSTGSEGKGNRLDLSEGPRPKHKIHDRDLGYLANSDIVIPQARKQNQQSPPHTHGSGDSGPKVSMLSKFIEHK